MPAGTWKEKARLAVRLAREAAAEGGRPETAVVFVMMIQDGPKEEWGRNGPSVEKGSKDWEERVTLDYLRELGGVFGDDRPDALMVELAPPIDADLSFPHFEALVASGIPTWISYRRAVGRPVAIFGEDLPADGDLFGRAARKLEEIGVAALLVHCLPPEKAHGVAAWLRGYTDSSPRRLPEQRAVRHVEVGVAAHHQPGADGRARARLCHRGFQHHRRLLRRPPGPYHRHRRGAEARPGGLKAEEMYHREHRGRQQRGKE